MSIRGADEIRANFGPFKRNVPESGATFFERSSVGLDQLSVAGAQVYGKHNFRRLHLVSYAGQHNVRRNELALIVYALNIFARRTYHAPERCR
ncbi:MAG: hypothetical protein WA982_17720 [Rubrobacteraceae bacterium]